MTLSYLVKDNEIVKMREAELNVAEKNIISIHKDKIISEDE